MEHAVYYYILFFIVHSVSGQSFVKCYNVSDYEHCLSTDKVQKTTWYVAKTYCRANNSRLLSITNNDIASISLDLRVSAGINTDGAWIDVSTAAVDNFHWLNGPTGSPSVDNQDGDQVKPVTRRFAVITIISNQLVYYAQTFGTLSFYICQYSGEVCGSSDFTKNSKCYMKYNSEQVTWFTASNKCLSKNGSLATFNDLSDPRTNNDNDLRLWLNITTNSTRYWIGLVRRWFVTTTTTPDGSSIDVQYTNWQSGSPSAMYTVNVDDNNRQCVLLASRGSEWLGSVSCDSTQSFVCQSIIPLNTTPTSSTSSATVASTSTVISKSSPTVISITGSSSTYNSTTAIKNTSTSNTSIIVGVVVGVGVPIIIAIVVVVVLVVYRHQRKRPPISPSKVPKDIDRLTSTNGSINKPETPSPQLGRQQPEGNEAQYAVVERTKEPENGLVTTTNNNEQRHTQTYATIVRNPQANTFENNAYENPSEELAGGSNGGHVIYADLAPASPLFSET